MCLIMCLPQKHLIFLTAIGYLFRTCLFEKSNTMADACRTGSFRVVSFARLTLGFLRGRQYRCQYEMDRWNMKYSLTAV